MLCGLADDASFKFLTYRLADDASFKFLTYQHGSKVVIVINLESRAVHAPKHHFAEGSYFLDTEPSLRMLLVSNCECLLVQAACKQRATRG